MEKASDVYNKLKLRFVGKAEVAAKPKTENKEPEENEQTQNTGKIQAKMVNCKVIKRQNELQTMK